MISPGLNMITNEKPTWGFFNKWFTYDTEQGEPSNVVVCPACAPILQKDPSLRPLQDQSPDPNKKCSLCEKDWE